MTGPGRTLRAVPYVATALLAALVAYRVYGRVAAPPSPSPAPSRAVPASPEPTVTAARVVLIVATALVAILVAYGAYGRGMAAPSPTAGPPQAVRASPVPAVAAAIQTPAPTAPATPVPTPTRPPLVLAPGAPWTRPANMPILMYHHVNSAPPASDLDFRLTVTDADFSRQLAYLRCAGYYSITLSQLFEGIYNGAPLPEKPVILTFDDGYADAYTDAFLQLKWAGFSGSFAVVTGFVGQSGYLNWAQMQEMAGAGMEMVAHSVNHPDLGKEPDEVVRDQLSRSKRDLEEKLGQPVPFFVYPSGEPFRSGTKKRQAQVVAMLQEAGYRGALTATWNLAQDPAAPFALNRVRVAGGAGIQAFAKSVGGPAPEAIGC